MASYEGTSTPFESMSLREIRDPVVAGPGTQSLVQAADALEAVARKLEDIDATMAAVERAYAESHQGDAAEEARAYLRRLGEPGRIGALTFASASSALRAQAEHYRVARKDLETVEDPVAPVPARTAAAVTNEQGRAVAAEYAAQYEMNSNQNVVAFEAFTPVALRQPDTAPATPPPNPAWPIPGGAGGAGLAPAVLPGSAGPSSGLGAIPGPVAPTPGDGPPSGIGAAPAGAPPARGTAGAAPIGASPVPRGSGGAAPPGSGTSAVMPSGAVPPVSRGGFGADYLPPPTGRVPEVRAGFGGPGAADAQRGAGAAHAQRGAGNGALPNSECEGSAVQERPDAVVDQVAEAEGVAA